MKIYDRCLFLYNPMSGKEDIVNNLDYIVNRLDTTMFNTTKYNANPEGLYLKKVYYGRSEIDED